MTKGKIKESFFQPRPGKEITRKHVSNINVKFEPLPDFEANYPYTYEFSTGTSDSIAIHVIGDSGAVRFPISQRIVADAMERDAARNEISFCYHVGDVVYENGEDKDYYDQFYKPYEHYPPHILGIPGNHDGDPVDPNSASLHGFVTNFCSDREISPDAREINRNSMDQPNVYWTLITPLFEIIGLYSNVPPGGEIRKPQYDWFVAQLGEKARRGDKVLIVAVHHPPYSYDNHHSGSQHIKDVLSKAFTETKIHPDLVISGHVHNYQRFTLDDQYPYIVIGNSGYWHLHGMKEKGLRVPADLSEQNDTKTVLEKYVSDRHGFLKLKINKKTISGEFHAVSRPHESWSAPPRVADTFTYNVKKKR